MGQDTYKLFLRDFIYLLKEYREESNKNDLFADGEKFGYSRVIDLIENQAAAFGIDLEEMGFYDYEKYKNKNNAC